VAGLEVANAFQTAIRRQRIDAVYRDASLAELGLMPITIDADTRPTPGRRRCGCPNGFP
jgi:hypothetical protein